MPMNKMKKVIDNKMYCKKVNVLIEEDDYAILEKYAQWAKQELNQAIEEILAYSLRIIRNILKYHKNFNNLESLVEYIADENKIDLQEIKGNHRVYSELFQQCKNYCENRCEYMPYERSYWYDILLSLIKAQKTVQEYAKQLKN